MSQFAINLLFVGASFALYIGIAIWARAGSTKDFYVAGGGVRYFHNLVTCMLFFAAITSANSPKIAFLLSEGLVVLARQQRRRGDHRDLHALHRRHEGGADRHLGLAEADVAAD